MGAPRTTDLVVLGLYLVAVLALGLSFRRRSLTPRGFTTANGRLPLLAVGLSVFATYLSSNTFIGVPGRAFATNWNAFVFSLALPPAAFVAARYFVPFYRGSGEVSAYAHLESRFGAWARYYAVVCYLLTQLARVGTILFGVGIALSQFTGWPIGLVILTGGVAVTLYTLVGGIEAVIWTDAAQSVVLMAGGLYVAVTLLWSLPGGPAELVTRASASGKFSLGSTQLDFTESTVWVVLLYGFFINLNNFGIDQSFVQRYHVARSERDARRAVWLAALLYIPISLVFFFIGAALFAFYEVFPVSGVSGDNAFPHYIATELPAGVAGLLLAALAAAAMSSIDTSLNSGATVVLEDVYGGMLGRDLNEKQQMRVLRTATTVAGILGTAAAMAMIGVASLLDAWWTLSGVFAGGMLGLFLLGALARKVERADSMIAVSAGVLVILWMTFSPRLPIGSALRSGFHSQMTTVVGTLVIFLVGVTVSRLRRRGWVSANGSSR